MVLLFSYPVQSLCLVISPPLHKLHTEDILCQLHGPDVPNVKWQLDWTYLLPLRTHISSCREPKGMGHTIDRFFVIVMVHNSTCQLCAPHIFASQRKFWYQSSTHSGIPHPVWMSSVKLVEKWRYLIKHTFSTGYETRGLYLTPSHRN